MNKYNPLTFLITGATSGIGKATAKSLAQKGATVIFNTRDQGRGEAARQEIQEAAGHDRVHLYDCDLASLSQIRSFAQQVKADFPVLDGLINNAGVWVTERKETEDGHEVNWAVNHLAPFLLTNLLLEPLKASPQGRVVNVASAAHQMGKLDFDDLQGKNRSFSGINAYGTSKLANIAFTVELARRLEGTSVTANALHPGVINTGIAREANVILRTVFKLFPKGPRQGAQTSLYLATSDEVKGVSGKYFDNKKETQAKAIAYNPEAGKRLWDQSMQMVNGNA
jgi:NAD(P)-dependent dehydrogenase (short-subunit alcohol dehydrogenase family)